jgi:hypothetical protein
MIDLRRREASKVSHAASSKASRETIRKAICDEGL